MRARSGSLRKQDRADLCRGILRRWRRGDTPSKFAARAAEEGARLHERRVWEAIDEPLAKVKTMYGPGCTAAGIARDTGLPYDFIVSAMRIISGRRDPKQREIIAARVEARSSR